MLTPTLLLTTALLSQTPAAAPKAAEPAAQESATAAERAAAAAERAAAAAERAAEASARLAEALERLAPPKERAKPAEPEARPAEAPAAAPAPNPWHSTVGLGFIALYGNASTLTFNGLVLVERKTEDWIFTARAFGVYGQSRPPETTEQQSEQQVVALNAGLTLRADRRFLQNVSGYLLAGSEMDHVRSVEFRGYGEGGVGITWWDDKKEDGRVGLLRTDLAFRYMRETRFQYFPSRMDLPDVDLASPRFGLSFRYSLTKDVLFQEDVEVLPNVLGTSRVLVNNTAKLTARLTEWLSMGASFLVQHDSLPAEGKLPTDSQLSMNVEIAL